MQWQIPQGIKGHEGGDGVGGGGGVWWWRDMRVIIPFNFQGKVKSVSLLLNFSGKNIPYFILKMLQLLNSEMVILKVTHIMKAGNPPSSTHNQTPQLLPTLDIHPEPSFHILLGHLQ